ncbi:MAG: DedA family protein [Nitrospirota bacterium]|nr:DedA family protein [Nitrospirota bacterium]
MELVHWLSQQIGVLSDWMLAWAATPKAEWALFAIAFAESSFFPLPPDVLLIAMALSSPDHATRFAGICTAGSVLGGMFGYGIGRWGGKPLLDRFVERQKTERIHAWFNRYEAWAIGIAGFTPVPYKVFTIAAGVFWIHFWRFVLVSMLSRGARFLLVATLVALYGARMRELIVHYFDLFSVAAVVILAVAVWLLHRARNNGQNNRPKTGQPKGTGEERGAR